MEKFAIVGTEYGPVIGAKESTVLGRNYYSFKSIPYMKAPVGNLRFRDAQPPEKWEDALKTYETRPSYFSVNPMTRKVEGQEDAGIVSIHTPYLNPSKPLPVAVFIHGGGFQYAHGESDIFGSDYLLQKDIIFVSINYRVGPLGFLSLKDPSLNIPGNAGLKDQVFALKWVQRNIMNFGGDPNNVTLFGVSAGAVSVHFLMISEKGKGLFNRAIPLSGTSFIKSWVLAPRKDITERLAKSLGWDGNGGEKEILEVLENADASAIVEAESKILTKEEIMTEHILFPFVPVVEPYVNENTFVPEDPILMGRKAWSNDIDCLLGGTSLEGSLMFFGFSGSDKFWEYITTPETLVPKWELKTNSTRHLHTFRFKQFGDKLKRLYFGDKNFSEETKNEYLRHAGDLHFWHGIYRAVISRVVSKGTGKTFLYRFDAQTSLNMSQLFFQTKLDGAGHGDDSLYLFYPNVPFFKTPEIGSKEFMLSKQMISLVTSFIINGTPEWDGCDFKCIEKASNINSVKDLQCLNIGTDSTEITSLPEQDRLKVWDEMLNDVKIPVV
ncbi:CLUMA_CG013140, isoform A [Clunio marinus]|uniref:Carboxylic ester hydrolase n=1 Tax=Clunio marinus TaxID=568069 RepID=A0A1J1II06_9DIPT|nr:CLUMA_CG013140, isoform A [Clunio marinus]